MDVKAYYNTVDAPLCFAKIEGLFANEEIAFDYIPPHSKTLDLGCGAGRTTGFLKSRGHDVAGVDISSQMIKAARNEDQGIEYSVGDACALSFKDKLFDAVVFSFNGIDHIYPYEKRIQALNEVKRVLKPGGFFVFSSHNSCIPRDLDSVIPFVNMRFRRKINTYMIDREYQWGTTKIFLTTPALQIRELETSGFELVALIPKKEYLRKVKSLRLIGLIDYWTYYVARTPTTN